MQRTLLFAKESVFSRYVTLSSFIEARESIQRREFGGIDYLVTPGKLMSESKEKKKKLKSSKPSYRFIDRSRLRMVDTVVWVEASY
jgi:hypothetical protein